MSAKRLSNFQCCIPSFPRPRFCVDPDSSPLTLLSPRATLPPAMNDIPPFSPLDPATLWDTLVRAVRDFVDAHRFPGAFVSLSGGIDSALVATLAVDALGPSRVLSATYPSPYTSRETLADALETARRLGIPCPVVPIEPAFRALADALPPPASYPAAPPLPGNLVEENLQARVRGLLNMALSNRHGHAVLCTGNRSEGLTGYCTLYGDTCGAFAPIRDVYKTEVFALARHRNARTPDAPPIPVSTIERPPSAELRPDQKDSDSLPPYP
ncbi:MAG: NAD(+) synthase, partial [Kiritimatiellae bacterium]|nr:NAD(+) synthase [Kiritimatiellia bacterium]